MHPESISPVPAPSGPRWHRRKQARPSEIIDAALIEFVEHGFAGSRLEDIARRAGCTKGTIFLYFDSKQELFKAMVRRTMLPVLETGESLIERHDGTAQELLVSLLRQRFEYMTNTAACALPKLMLSEAANFPELARFYHDEIITRSHSIIERALKSGVERGEFREMDTSNVARAAVAPLLLVAAWKFSFMKHAQVDLDPVAYFETALDVLLRGIRRDGAQEPQAHA
jgi:AcrR family transcriptional regulator